MAGFPAMLLRQHRVRFTKEVSWGIRSAMPSGPHRIRSSWVSSCVKLPGLNQDQRNFRIFGPDETLSNLLGAVFEATNRHWDALAVKNDEFLAPAGRVLDSMLSEHQRRLFAVVWSIDFSCQNDMLCLKVSS